VTLEAFADMCAVPVALAGPMRVKGSEIDNIVANPHLMRKVIASGRAREVTILGHTAWRWTTPHGQTVTAILDMGVVEFVSVVNVARIDSAPVRVVDAIYRRRNGILPKGFVAAYYMYLVETFGAVATSDEQYIDGERFWHRLIEKACAEGHSIYAYDMRDGKHIEFSTDLWGDAPRNRDFRVIIRRN